MIRSLFDQGTAPFDKGPDRIRSTNDRSCHDLIADYGEAMDQPVSRPTRSQLGDRILKVNHAGEQGAICVYRAQWTVAGLTAPSMREQLADFLIHEKRHRSIFGAALMQRGLPRCRSYALCSAGGYVLGTLTALMGRKAIAATTIAIESVVLRHLAEQRTELVTIDPTAAALIDSIIDDEQQHHDRSLDQIDIDNPLLRALRFVVTQATEAVIWMGMKL